VAQAIGSGDSPVPRRGGPRCALLLDSQIENRPLVATGRPERPQGV